MRVVSSLEGRGRTGRQAKPADERHVSRALADDAEIGMRDHLELVGGIAFICALPFGVETRFHVIFNPQRERKTLVGLFAAAREDQVGVVDDRGELTSAFLDNVAPVAPPELDDANVKKKRSVPEDG